MKFARFKKDGRVMLAVAERGEEFHGRFVDEISEFGDLIDVLNAGDEAVASLSARLLKGEPLDPACEHLPPLASRGKIICIGLPRSHERDGLWQPDYPTIFARFSSSLVGHRQPIVRPTVSTHLDYEGEIAVIIGKGGRAIPKSAALDHVFGYALFNDATLRDYQSRTPQWTVGKNFDNTASFGPYIVTTDELPPGARGLRLQTRLNGEVLQDASTDDLLFDVATLVETISEVMTLNPGDVIVSGTPAGVGMAHTPPLWMKPGDVCAISAEGLGSLINPVAEE
ncbi:fumarylacetoacetate hydrolase family protein [Cupriavidus necator]